MLLDWVPLLLLHLNLITSKGLSQESHQELEFNIFEGTTIQLTAKF